MKKILFIFTIAILFNITVHTNTKWYIAKSEKDLKCSADSKRAAAICKGRGKVTCYTGVDTKEKCEAIRKELAEMDAKIKNKYYGFQGYGFKDMQCFEGEHMNIRDCQYYNNKLQTIDSM